MALIETGYVREVSDGIATQQLAVLRMTHRMRISPHPEGLLVQFDNQKAIAAGGDMTDALGALLLMVGSTDHRQPAAIAF